MRNQRAMLSRILLLSILVCSCDDSEPPSRDVSDTRWQRYTKIRQKPYKEITLQHIRRGPHFMLSPDLQKALYGHYISVGLNGSRPNPTIYLIDMNSGDVIKKLESQIYQTIQGTAFSSDGKRAVSCGSLPRETEERRTGTLSFWNLESGKLLGYTERKRDYLRSVAYSPVDDKVITGGEGNDILLWDLAKMEVLKKFVGHSSGIRSNCLVWSKDANTFLSGSWDGSIRLWDVQTGKEVAHLQAKLGRVMSLALSPDGKYALSSYLNGLNQPVILWDLENQREINRFGIPGNPWDADQSLHVASVAFSPDGKSALFGVVFGTVIWWDLNEWRLIAMNRLYDEELQNVAYSIDGKSSISVGWDTDIDENPVKVKYWQLPDRNRIKNGSNPNLIQDKNSSQEEGQARIPGKKSSR